MVDVVVLAREQAGGRPWRAGRRRRRRTGRARPTTRAAGGRPRRRCGRTAAPRRARRRRSAPARLDPPRRLLHHHRHTTCWPTRHARIRRAGSVPARPSDATRARTSPGGRRPVPRPGRRAGRAVARAARRWRARRARAARRRRRARAGGGELGEHLVAQRVQRSAQARGELREPIGRRPARTPARGGVGVPRVRGRRAGHLTPARTPRAGRGPAPVRGASWRALQRWRDEPAWRIPPASGASVPA